MLWAVLYKGDERKIKEIFKKLRKVMVEIMQNLRVLSQIFSPPMFQKIVREDDFALFKRQTKKHFDATSYNTNLDIIKSLYKSLQK